MTRGAEVDESVWKDSMMHGERPRSRGKVHPSDGLELPAEIAQPASGARPHTAISYRSGGGVAGSSGGGMMGDRRGPPKNRQPTLVEDDLD